MLNSIGLRIFLALFVVLTTFVIAVFVATQGMLSDTTKRYSLQGLKGSVLAYHRYDAQRRDLMLTQAHSLAETPHLKATLTIPDVDDDTLSYAGALLRDVVRAPLLLILDTDGNLLTDVNRLSADSISLLAMPGVTSAQSGTEHYGHWRYEEKLYRVAVVPVIAAQQFIGIIVVGQQLDSLDAVSVAEDISGSSVIQSHAAAGQLIATTTSSTGDEIVASLDSATPVDTVENVELVATKVDDRLYYVAAERQPEIDEVLYFYRDANVVPADFDSAGKQIFAASMITLAIGVLLSVLVSMRISRPVRKLTDAASAFALGNFSVRVEQESRDEIGQLAHAFNEMAQVIQVARDQLVASRDLAEDASRAKSEFLATMSHEIRTPMNGVLGMLELLEHSPLNDTQKAYVEVIRNSGDMLLGIINDILDFSKIEAGKLDLDIAAFDLDRLMSETSEIFKVQAQTKGLVFNCASPEDIPRLLGDPTRLKQVLTNLIGNAVKFTEEGTVTVSAMSQAVDDSHLDISIAVADTGIGISEEVQHDIFQPFAQADSGTTRNYGGTGLGLAISRRLMQLMGGDIELESAPGEGSEFIIRLRLKRA